MVDPSQASVAAATGGRRRLSAGTTAQGAGGQQYRANKFRKPKQVADYGVPRSVWYVSIACAAVITVIGFHNKGWEELLDELWCATTIMFGALLGLKAKFGAYKTPKGMGGTGMVVSLVLTLIGLGATCFFPFLSQPELCIVAVLAALAFLAAYWL